MNPVSLLQDLLLDLLPVDDSPVAAPLILEHVSLSGDQLDREVVAGNVHVPQRERIVLRPTHADQMRVEQDLDGLLLGNFNLEAGDHELTASAILRNTPTVWALARP
jgi:hypothetical protein